MWDQTPETFRAREGGATEGLTSLADRGRVGLLSGTVLDGKNRVEAWRTHQAWRSFVFVSRRSFSPEIQEATRDRSREIQDSLHQGLDLFSLDFMLLGPRRVFMRFLGDLTDVPRIFEGVQSTVRRSGGVLRREEVGTMALWHSSASNVLICASTSTTSLEITPASLDSVSPRSNSKQVEHMCVRPRWPEIPFLNPLNSF